MKGSQVKHTLQRLVGLPTGRMSSSPLAHLPAALLGGSATPMKVVMAFATSVLFMILEEKRI